MIYIKWKMFWYYLRYKSTICRKIYCTDCFRRWRPVTVTCFKISGANNYFCHFCCRCMAISVYCRSSALLLNFVNLLFYSIFVELEVTKKSISSLFQYKNIFYVYLYLKWQPSKRKSWRDQFFSPKKHNISCNENKHETQPRWNFFVEGAQKE